MNLEELKRLHANSNAFGNDWRVWTDRITNAFPAIVAKLEAAQRLRASFDYMELDDMPPQVYAAMKAFDKEQQ